MQAALLMLVERLLHGSISNAGPRRFAATANSYHPPREGGDEEHEHTKVTMVYSLGSTVVSGNNALVTERPTNKIEDCLVPAPVILVQQTTLLLPPFFAILAAP
jgi:hypothetical protein